MSYMPRGCEVNQMAIDAGYKVIVVKMVLT